MENTANTTNDKFIVTGLFKDKDSAECAFNALTGRGYDKAKADVMMSDETRDRYYSSDTAADDTELGSKAAARARQSAELWARLSPVSPPSERAFCFRDSV